MLEDPICRRLFQPNVMAGFFGLDPLVFQDFFAFGLQLPVKQRFLEQIVVRELFFSFLRHNRKDKVPFVKLPRSSSIVAALGGWVQLERLRIPVSVIRRIAKWYPLPKSTPTRPH